VSKFKNRMGILLPSLLAFYCLIQGGMLAIEADPLARIAGVCMLLWVPLCAYCVRRGYKGQHRKTVAVNPAAPQQNPADSQAFA
jgi:hypothetical protein